jgi:hypothetical protein
MNPEGENNFGINYDSPEPKQEVFETEEQAKKALELAVASDNQPEAAKALDAMEFLKRAKLADSLLDTMKEVQFESESEDLDRLEAKFLFEDSAKISFEAAEVWCKEHGGVLPAAEDLKQVFDARQKKENLNRFVSFTNLSYWTSEVVKDEKGDVDNTKAVVFNMKEGKTEIVDKSEVIHVARAAKKSQTVYSDGNETKQ